MKKRNAAKFDQVCTWDLSWSAADFARNLLGFHPDPTQSAILASHSSNIILNCCRQWGKSTIAAIKAIHHAFSVPNSLTIVLSPSARQSAEFLRKVTAFLCLLGISPSQNELSLLFPNGARIIGLPANRDTIRGFSAVTLLIIDEASRVSDDLYNSVTPMCATSAGHVWLISTPNGKQGFFYNAWAHGGDSWQRFSVPASQCARIPASFLDKQRASMTRHTFRQEFLCEFLDPARQLIPTAEIERALIPHGHPLLSNANPSPAPLRRHFYLGIDFGKVLDHTAFVIIEKSLSRSGPHSTFTRLAVRFLKRIPLGTPYNDIVDGIASLVRFPGLHDHIDIILDETGVGRPMVDMLRARGLNVPLFPVNITSGATASLDAFRWYVPRQHLIRNLLMHFEGRRLDIAEQLPDARTLARELASLTVRVNKSGYETITTARAGQHDDLVFALALACWRSTKDHWPGAPPPK